MRSSWVEAAGHLVRALLLQIAKRRRLLDGLASERGEFGPDVGVRRVDVDAGRIDDRFLRQVSGAKPRSLKSELPSTGTLQFDPAEVQTLGRSMLTFMNRSIEAVLERARR